MHATNTGVDGGQTDWRFECVPWEGTRDPTAVAFLKIGDIDPDFDWTLIVEYVKDIPMDIPSSQRAREPKFTCRVWFKEAIRMLNESGMFVKCPDVDALEEELRQRAIYAAFNRKVIIESATKAVVWTY